MGNILRSTAQAGPAGPSVCLVNAHLGPAFRELGFRVLELHPGPGILDIDRELAAREFRPDLLLQVEHLGGRVVLRGLGRLSCPRLFWAVDPHLNLFWQIHYGRLFDAVLSTQRTCLEGLRGAGAGRALWLPWHGIDRPFVPFRDRVHQVAFVGRVTEHRPLRQAMVRFLSERFGAALFQDVPSHEMFDIYGRTRLAPNEAILGEINFRLFEAASCGCLVLNPEVSAGLAELFRPGLEVETYGHGLELQARLAWLQAHPAEAERRGLAAWTRVREDHLPIHRARAIADLARELPRTGAAGAEADKRLLLALAALRQAGLMNVDLGPLVRGLAGMPDDPDVLAGLIVLLAEENQAGQVLPSLADILGRNLGAEDFGLNLAGSMAALRLGSWELARGFWRRQARSDRGPGGPGGEDDPAGPSSPAALHLLWATGLARRGRVIRPGFQFNHARHLPLTAVENVLAAHLLDPSDLDTVRRLEALLATEPGTEQPRLALLSHLSMHRPGDWRTALRLGLVNLKCWRPEQGVEEILLARDKAGAAGQAASFGRMLAAGDPGGRVERAMGGAGGRPAPA